MKRFISALLILLLLNAMVFTVSAESAETVEAGEFALVSMSEEEFRSYSSGISMFGMPRGVSGYHKNGYYYSLIQRKNVLGIAKETYEHLVADLANEPLSGYWTVTFKTNLFNEMSLSDFLDIGEDVIRGEIWSGGFCFKYDNPDKCDRFTNAVSAGYGYRALGGKITEVTITVQLEVHPYFNSNLLIERDNKINEIVAVANRKPSQYLALKYIHDILDEMAEYDHDNVNALPGTEAFLFDHSALGILAGIHKWISGKDTVQRKAVCEGYAKAFMEICQKLDDAPYVGVLTSATHMWNIVMLDGKWYCIDLTWDDGDSWVDDTYFLCGDPDIVDGIYTDHVPDGDYADPPEYAASKYVFNPAKGDITFDGVINVLDIIRFKKINSGALDKEFYKNADLDGNNIFNASDLARLRKQVINN